jgi:16S rRNA G966 N2-methylase RsmD
MVGRVSPSPATQSSPYASSRTEAEHDGRVDAGRRAASSPLRGAGPRGPGVTNHLYYGDNLEVLRDRVPSESVDLVYLDPPFNSNRSYNVLFK